MIFKSFPVSKTIRFEVGDSNPEKPKLEGEICRPIQVHKNIIILGRTNPPIQSH